MFCGGPLPKITPGKQLGSTLVSVAADRDQPAIPARKTHERGSSGQMRAYWRLRLGRAAHGWRWRKLEMSVLRGRTGG